MALPPRKSDLKARGLRRSVAINAARRRGFVKENALVFYEPDVRVARGTAHIFVCALERKRCFLVIEQRRSPFRAVVALGATGDVSLGELSAVDVGVAFFAKFWRGREIRIAQFHSQVRGFVTINAGHRSMGSHQPELR